MIFRIFIIFLGFCLSNSSLEKKQGTYEDSLNTAINQLLFDINKVPDFSLYSSNDEMYNIRSLEGKVVLINFWATWRGPCRMEIPDFIELHDKYNDKGFENEPVKQNFDKTVDVSQLDKKEENNTLEIEDSNDDSIIKEENKSENDVDEDLGSMLALDDVNSGYPDVLKLIEDKNAKTFHFLEKTMIDKIVDLMSDNFSSSQYSFSKLETNFLITFV